MATRSIVARKLNDQQVAYIRVHNDGYVKGVGQTLVAHYGDTAKVDWLLARGHISSLKPEVLECQRTQGVYGQIVAGMAALLDTFRNSDADYCYVRIHSTWYMMLGDGGLVKVKDIKY